MARAEIVPVFIPHGGCRYRCVFCDQHGITGTAALPAIAELEALFTESAPERELAFYGGSFTALPHEQMLAYLAFARGLKQRGRIGRIRLSTHPAHVGEEIVRLLLEFTVDTVELGVQSTDDEVLRLSGRGHDGATALAALRRLKEAGFCTGAQLMTGLPGDSREKTLRTVREIVACRPELVRIYPLLVLKNTPLAELTAQGGYVPVALDDAVTLVRDMLAIFLYENITVIRMGLQMTEDLHRASDLLLAGPFHESFGHLVKCALKKQQLSMLTDGVAGDLTIACPPRELPQLFGQNGDTMRALRATRNVTVRADEGLPEGSLALRAPVARLLTAHEFLKEVQPCI